MNDPHHTHGQEFYGRMWGKKFVELRNKFLQMLVEASMKKLFLAQKSNYNLSK